MALSLGAEGVTHLEGGQWEASVNYRYLPTHNGYIGDQVWPQYPEVQGARIRIHSIDVQVTYAFSSRYSATLTMPFVRGEISSLFEHNGTRHATSAGGLGDIRLIGSAWLLDPETHKDGNLSLGVGVKAPTGNEKATGTFYTSTGPETRTVHMGIQPGDGGWGIQLELAGYRKIIERLHGYVSGFYLINPREQQDAITTVAIYGQFRNLSVPDQYLGRVGLSYAVWPEQGLSLSVGGRTDGVPSRDLVGGSEGFRLPGLALYVEPGVSWTRGEGTFNFYAPVLTYANRTKNIYDDRYGGHGPGAFADHLLIASFTRRF